MTLSKNLKRVWVGYRKDGSKLGKSNKLKRILSFRNIGFILDACQIISYIEFIKSCLFSLLNTSVHFF